MESSQSEVKRSNFPKNFIFGAATSAYQVEGAWNEGGKGRSNWDVMTVHSPDSTVDGRNGCVALDHYNLFKEDVALIKKVGLDSYRFSIAWSRILPCGRLCAGISKEGIKYYNDLIDALLAEGIEPCATIFHWDIPQCLEDEYGGFLDHQVVKHFCEFAEVCFWEFGDRVKRWITLNEPWAFSYCGYVRGNFPPRRGKPPPNKAEPETGVQDGANLMDPVMSLLGATSMEELAESIEQLLRNLILHHRSAIPPLTPPSDRDPITELLAMLFNLPTYLKGILGIDPFAIAQNVADLTPVGGILGTQPFSLANQFTNLTSSTGVLGTDLSSLIRIISTEIPVVVAHIFPSLTFLIRTLRTELCVTDPAAGDPGREPYIVAHNLILAHAHAVNIYRKNYKDHQGGTIGMTNVSKWYYPYRDIPEDVEAASRGVDFMLGWFVAPVITGDYPPSMRKNVGEPLPIFTPEEVKLVKGSCDFLGINYYTSNYAKNIPKKRCSRPHYDNDRHVEDHTHRNGKPIGEQGGSSWLYIVPEGIYHLMLHIKERYNNPEIFITENGVDEVNNKAITVTKARVDETRMKYHRSHLAYLKKAMDHQVRVKGYFIWSLLDNFEWAQGYNSRFGIFYVDYENGRLTRFPKTSAVWWMNFLENPKNPWNRLPLKLQDVETEEERHGPAKKPRSGLA